MNFGIIDIGSNSVRLLLTDGDTRKKYVNTCRLAEGMTAGGLHADAMARTAAAVKEYCQKAGAENAGVYIFATEAVRSAKNKEVFLSGIRNATGYPVDVLSGEQESEIGFLGAYSGGNAIVLDIGGGSTELVFGNAEGVRYAKSVPLGVVRLQEAAGEDIGKLEKCTKEYLAGFEQHTGFDRLIGIGGTVTSLQAIRLGLTRYDPVRVQESALAKDAVFGLFQRLRALTIEERLSVAGLQPGRIHTIVPGAYWLYRIMEFLDIEELNVSDSDNLEGYLQYIIRKRSLT